MGGPNRVDIKCKVVKIRNLTATRTKPSSAIHFHQRVLIGAGFTTGASLVAQMVKHLSISVGDLGSIPGSERFPGEGNGTPLQYSRLENPMGGGAW